ncbi:MAG: 4Fe-4S binding protein [Proteobacteria bacterium]|nr:4Fe-4S binding protein [Pseudomonadota bacterium]
MTDRYEELAGRVGLSRFPRIVRLIEMMADAEEAELLLALPGEAGSLAARLGRDVASVDGMLKTLFVKGLAFPNLKSDPPAYRLVRDAVQFHDSSILWPEAPSAFLDLWQEFMEEDGYEVFKLVADRLPRPVMRVIPVGLTVPVESRILAFEDVRQAIEEAEIMAVTRCTCKVTARKCETTLECCLQLNNAARYALARGTGRELNREEALALMKRSEEEGLIHTVNNLKSMHTVICNCCPCCCQNFPGLVKYGIRTVDPSRFTARIDPDRCTGCGACLDRCYFGAIEMETDLAVVAEPDRCMGCGLCQVTCPAEAIDLIEVRPPDFIPDGFSAH